MYVYTVLGHRKRQMFVIVCKSKRDCFSHYLDVYVIRLYSSISLTAN